MRRCLPTVSVGTSGGVGAYLWLGISMSTEKRSQAGDKCSLHPCLCTSFSAGMQWFRGILHIQARDLSVRVVGVVEARVGGIKKILEP